MRVPRALRRGALALLVALVTAEASLRGEFEPAQYLAGAPPHPRGTR